MVKVKRTPIPPASLAIEKEKANGSYREPDVVDQLMRDFSGKCYICEIGDLQSIEIEHLRPHGGDREKKFAWDNLFLSCAHCNSIKNQNQYKDVVLDCCKEDPEAVLQQRLKDGHVCVACAVGTASHETEMTAKLIRECFEKANTGIRVYECQTRINALSQTMDTLYRDLEQFKAHKSTRYLRSLRGMLSRTYKFSGFTRTYVREHLNDYPELAEYVTL